MPFPRRSHPVLLELDLTDAMTEAQPSDPLLRPLTWNRATLRGVVRGLRLAREDPHVLGLIARTGGGNRPLAQAQELRAAILEFRAAGKPAITWAETYGELGLGTVAYYLATAFDEIWLQPSGDVGITGIAAEATFLRDALARAGLRPQFEARHEYKNAPNIFTEQAYTATHREATHRIVSSALDQIVTGIAQARGLTPEVVRGLVDRAPLSGAEAGEAKLVDHLGYRDEAYAAARAKFAKPAKLSYLGRYVANRATIDNARRAVRRDKRMVALVDAHGAIKLGRSGPGLLGAGVGADTLNAALRAAIADENVRAVVLRVDSPGGSYVASDSIWRTTQLARKAGKPLIVSMGNLAASGGYYVSMAADRIVAQPGTLTGSIGVFGGKIVTAGLLDRLGVGHDAIAEGEHARFTSRAGAVRRQRPRPARLVARPGLRRLHCQGRRRAQAEPRGRPRGRPRPGLDGGGRPRVRPRRRPRRAGRRRPDRVPGGEAARRRAGPDVPRARPPGADRAAGVQRSAGRDVRGLATGLGRVGRPGGPRRAATCGSADNAGLVPVRLSPGTTERFITLPLRYLTGSMAGPTLGNL